MLTRSHIAQQAQKARRMAEVASALGFGQIGICKDGTLLASAAVEVGNEE